MANLAVDSTSSGGSTHSHTCVSGASLLVVTVEVSTGSVGFPSSVTYNGVAMTQQSGTGPGTVTISIWTLANPSSGANSVIVTTSGSPAVQAISFTGAYEIGNVSVDSNTGTTASTTFVTAKSSGFVVACNSFASTATTYAYTGSGTVIGSLGATASGVYKAYTGSADPTESWTVAASRIWASDFIEIANLSSPSGFFLATSR
jgi:hypothetical protein